MLQSGVEKAFIFKFNPNGNAKVGGFQPRVDSSQPSTSGKASANQLKKKGKHHREGQL